MSYYLVWSLNDSCDPRCLGSYECMIHDESGNVVAGVELLNGTRGLQRMRRYMQVASMYITSSSMRGTSPTGLGSATRDIRQ